jgi:protein-L-isoaspartate(D-aspartate) O-methyltransferase
MVLPVGRQGRDQNLLRLVRSPDGLVEEPLGDVRFVPLLGGLPDDPRSRPVEPLIGAAVKSPA